MFQLLDFIIDYESGQLSDAQIIDGFQQLINTGALQHLQGHYTRVAHELITSGLCTVQTLPSERTAQLWLN